MSALSTGRPVLFCLHFLGGSARAWSEVARALPELRVVAVDLPGFGDAASHPARSVGAMADHVAAVVRAAAPDRWALAGHSMGAKVAAVLARRAEDGEPGLAGLTHLVLVAGSPPGPEPMEEAQRAAMLGWFAGDAERGRAEADGYVTANIGAPLAPDAHERTVADVLRAETGAWRAWLESGSREDLVALVGRLRTPALLIAGGRDGPLGPALQRRVAAAHYERARVEVLDRAGHLMPIEAPAAMARLIGAHLGGAGEDWWRLLDSDRVSGRTRAVLRERGRADDPERAPEAMTVAQRDGLRAVLDRVLPQEEVDLAGRLDASLAAGVGDGWRFDALPPDREAVLAGLATLDAGARAAFGAAFGELEAERQDALLRRADGGTFEAAGPFGAAEMKLWFDDLRAEAVRLYVAHPATLARIGYSGMANGGDTPRQSGFRRVGPGEREPWEPGPA